MEIGNFITYLQGPNYSQTLDSSQMAFSKGCVSSVFIAKLTNGHFM